jgi:hypothetical protein
MRITESIRQAGYGALLLDMFMLIPGTLLAPAVDRRNPDRLHWRASVSS